jgi:hypothetical protein
MIENTDQSNLIVYRLQIVKVLTTDHNLVAIAEFIFLN